MVVRDPSESSGIGQLTAIQTLAPSFGVEAAPIDARDGKEIERTVNTFARSSNVGLITTLSGAAIGHRELLITLAAHHRLPAVYPARYFVKEGGLVSYGPNPVDGFRFGATYVDRILKGEKPADLPVQAPTKYELVFNLRTAKASRPRSAAELSCKRRRGHRVISSSISFWHLTNIPEHSTEVRFRGE
jgi:putative ABC transport system substrate-binding protein